MKTSKPRNFVQLALLRRAPNAGAHVKTHKQQRAAAQRQLRRQLKDEGGSLQHMAAVC